MQATRAGETSGRNSTERRPKNAKNPLVLIITSINILGTDMERFLRYSILFLCNWLLGSCAEVKIVEDGPKKAFNIVIFFTHVDGKCSHLQQDTLEFLGLHQATRVKLSAAEPQNTFQDEETGSEFCRDFLKDSLMSLTHFCHTVMKMKTAIASVSSKEMMNDIQEPEAPFHARSSRSENSQPAWLSVERPAAKPPQWEAEDLTANAKNIITGTQHTEVFQIRVRRNVEEEPAEGKRIHVKVIDDYPQERTSSHPWDVLDIMKHVRYSFLGDLFDDGNFPGA
ncbi:hypothetical protein HUJ05_008461 [Dendroctonus ponderosae]|nr:hypothetical protein HUJ05_008461 [Dendroctonus ponderosae]